MYFSRIRLDMAKKETRRGLKSPAKFHGALEDACRRSGARKLWRLDDIEGDPYLIIVSEEKPDLDALVSRFGDESDKPFCGLYDGYLEGMKAGDRKRFLLTANPVHSITQKEKTGKHVDVAPHRTKEAQIRWLAERAEKNGFSIDAMRTDVVDSKWYAFHKKDSNHVRIHSVSFKGVLTVKDPELFRKCLVNGVGREKAYGQGLMTVVPAG